MIKDRQLMLTCIVKQQLELMRTQSIAAWRIMAGSETVAAAGNNCQQGFNYGCCLYGALLAKSYYSCMGSYDSTGSLVCEDIFCYVEIAMVAICWCTVRNKFTRMLPHKFAA